MSLHLSKCHIVGNLMSRLICSFFFVVKNQEIIQDSGGITSLIQQLTQTENEELSKTVKYLLHMCVSSGKLSKKNKLEREAYSRLRRNNQLNTTSNAD